MTWKGILKALLRKAFKIPIFLYWHEKVGISVPIEGANLPSCVLQTGEKFCDGQSGACPSYVPTTNRGKPTFPDLPAASGLFPTKNACKG